jgi:tetratricopeptide (TPR) repeat protein
MKKILRLVSTVVLLIMVCISTAAQSATTPSLFSFSLNPGASFPLGSESDFFSIGGCADLSMELRMPFLPFLAVGLDLGYSYIPLAAVTSLSCIDACLKIGTHFDLGEKLDLRIFGSAGPYYGFFNEPVGTSEVSLLFAAEASLSYELMPRLSLGLGAAFRLFYQLTDDISVRTSLSYSLPRAQTGSPPSRVKPEKRPAASTPTKVATPADTSAGASGGGIELAKSEFVNVYPVFYKYYSDHSFGTLVVRNTGTTAIDDLKVSFLVKQYMENPKLCATVKSLGPGKEEAIEIRALFKNAILEITEQTLVSSTITVEYSAGGTPRKQEIPVEIRIQDRNAMTWDDDRKAASFVTSRDPTVQKFTKNVLSAVKGRASDAVDEKLLAAFGIHEALRVYGMSYVIDPTTPYQETSRNRLTVDFLQFPQQTLEYKAGDCDDLAILYCAMLESVGVETAFITIPGHIFTAFSLAASPDEARKTYQRPEDLIFLEGKAWVPIEVTERTGGFLKAWETGAKEWRENSARNQAKLFPTRASWALYEAVGFSSAVVNLPMPSDAKVADAYVAEVTTFIDREIYPRVSALQAEVKKAPGSPKPTNSLGVLYARYGLYDRAEREFKKLVSQDYVPALINLGNLAFILNTPRNSLEYFQRAQRKAPDDPHVLLGLARVHHELENYGEAKLAYDSLKRLDPDLANRFSYLGLRGEEAARAAQISQSKMTMIWEDQP